MVSRPERLVPIAERYGVDPDAALDNIVVARAMTSDHEMELVREIAARFHEDNFKVLSSGCFWLLYVSGE
jgi:meiotic recombination protein DMC1